MGDSDSDISVIASDNEVEQIEQIEEPTEEQEPPNPDAPEAEVEEERKPVKPKRVIKNPRPKLNAETLKGKRGLTALESYFERVKFKGRGYEEQDLGVILKTYEYWCHRLFPKFPFDECLDKIENLGKKKPVITHIKRIRTDLLLEDVPTENVNQDHGSDPEDINIDNAFDDLMAPATTTTPLDPLPAPEISEEQMARIRANKEAAERRRRERLEQQRQKALEFPEDDSDFVPASSSSQNVPTLSSSQNLVLNSQSESQPNENSLQEQDMNTDEISEVVKITSTSLSQESSKDDELSSVEPMDINQKENVPPEIIEDEDF